MILFWSIVAGLVLVALGFVVIPLLRGLKSRGIAEDRLNIAVIRQQMAELEADLAAGNLEQEQYEAAKADLERELLEDLKRTEEVADESPSPKTARKGRWAIPVVALVVPGVAVSLYLRLGNTDIIAAEQGSGQSATAQGRPAEHKGLPPMDELVRRLAEKMKEHPDNLQGWKMLGRSYLALGQPQKAVGAYESGLKVAPEDPEIILGLAEALAKANGGKLAGRPTELVQRAKKLHPGDPNVLWMSGLISYQSGRFAPAVEDWQKLVAMLPPESEDVAMIDQYLQKALAQLPPEEAKRLAAVAPPRPTKAKNAPVSTPRPGASAQDRGAKATAGGGRIKVMVDLDPALKDKVSPTDRLFIFARAAKGPRMPLAAVSKTAADLPLSLELNDGMAMTPMFRLSSFPEVVVSARISKSGSATPQSGDLQAKLTKAKPGQKETVHLTIDSVRP